MIKTGCKELNLKHCIYHFAANPVSFSENIAYFRLLSSKGTLKSFGHTSSGYRDLFSTVVLSDAINLILFTVIAYPIALYVFKNGYNAARKDGSLGQH